MLSFLRAITAVAFLVHSALGCGLLHADVCGGTAGTSCDHAAQRVGHDHQRDCGHDHDAVGAPESTEVSSWHGWLTSTCCCQSVPQGHHHGSHGLACDFVFVAPENSNLIALPVVSVHEIAWQPANATPDHAASLANLAPRNPAFLLHPAARCAVFCVWRI